MPTDFYDELKVLDAQTVMRDVMIKFMPNGQRRALLEALRGEERVGIAEVVLRAYERIKGTPKTYETESVETKDKIAQLHYFGGPVDAWIVERDIGDGTEEPGMGKQLQAYGKITLTGDKNDAEWGYISIADLIANGIELDLHFEPQRVLLIQETDPE